MIMAGRKKHTSKRSSQSFRPEGKIFDPREFTVVNFGRFLRKRKDWKTFHVVIFLDAHHPTTVKGMTYFIRILKRSVEYITRWDDSLSPPAGTGLLLTQRYYLVIESKSVSKKNWEHWEDWFRPERKDVYWIFTGLPGIPGEVFKKVRDRCLIIDEPYIPEQKVGDWFFDISKAYGILIKKEYIERIVSTLLYDQFRLIQLAETLAVAYGNEPIEWADIEPFLPSTRVFPSGKTVFQWIKDKNYANLLQLVRLTEKTSPSFQAMLHQGYETWRTWVFLNRSRQLSDSDVRRLWGSWLLRVRQYSSRQTQLTSFQLLQWARIASYWEVKCRHGAVDERTAFLGAMFEWLRVVA